MSTQVAIIHLDPVVGLARRIATERKLLLSLLRRASTLTGAAGEANWLLVDRCQARLDQLHSQFERGTPTTAAGIAAQCKEAAYWISAYPCLSHTAIGPKVIRKLHRLAGPVAQRRGFNVKVLRLVALWAETYIPNEEEIVRLLRSALRGATRPVVVASQVALERASSACGVRPVLAYSRE